MEARKAAAFTHELVVKIVPRRVKRDSSCDVRVNGEVLSIVVQLERRKLPVVGWREARKGDTLNSNGDSAFTNYFTLYKTLTKHFVVNVLSANSNEVSPVQVCFEACEGNSVFIAGIQKAQTFVLQQFLRKRGIRTTLHTTQCSVSHKAKVLRRIPSYLAVDGFPKDWSVLYEFQNDKGETVCMAWKLPNGKVVAIFGIGSIVDDIQFMNPVGSEIMTELLWSMLSQPSAKDSDEL